MSIFVNLSVIFWSLFPALMSYTQPSSSPLKVELRQLVSNSDLLIPKASPNQNQPLGFTYLNCIDISLTNGVAKFTATAQFAKIYYPYTALAAKYYIFGRYKSVSSFVRLRFSGATFSDHTGSGNFEYISMVNDVPAGISNIEVNDYRSSGWSSIEVDYIGAINITDLVSNGCLPSGLSDLEYKTLIDSIFEEIAGTFQDTYFYTETIADNYKWFSTGFVEKTSERDFLDYLGFFVWLVVPYLFVFLVYKLLKGVIYG